MLAKAADALGMGAIDSEEAAWQLARAILADLDRYHGASAAADTAGTSEVDEARTIYRSRVIAPLYPIFDSVLAERRTGPGPARAGNLPASAGPAKRVPRPILWAIWAGVVGIAGILVWRALFPSGEKMGDVAIPGTLDLNLGAGDQLSFTADTDVLFRDSSEHAIPKGCELRLVLVQNDRQIAQTACDLYSSGPGISIASSSSYSNDDASGMRRLRTEGQQVACSLRASTAGRATLRADSNLATCVPKVVGAVTHVFRSSSRDGR